MESNKYWDNIHLKYVNDEIEYDDWLNDYNDLFMTCNTKVLDLGCGLGNNTLYLKERGFKVVSLDFSQVALDNITNQIGDVETVLADIKDTLPFEDNSFDIIVSDLSLHYFDEETTIKIMKEIKRILSSSGHLIARVNSVKDVNYGANDGTEIESNYRLIDGNYKRFFSLIDCVKFFSFIGDVDVEEDLLNRYSKPKIAYRILVSKEEN